MMATDSKLLKKFSNKEYRHEYLREMTVGWILHQIRALREQRGWSQAKLGEVTSKPQSAIARIEDPSYGKWSVSTLLELSKAFDVALDVRFIDWRSFVDRTRDVSSAAMYVEGFDNLIMNGIVGESASFSKIVLDTKPTRSISSIDKMTRINWRMEADPWMVAASGPWAVPETDPSSTNDNRFVPSVVIAHV